MPKTSSSIERRRLLLALATLALSRHAAALPPGVTASDSAASDTASAPATQAALAPDLRAAVELAPQGRVADRVELQQAFVRTVSGHGEGLMLHVADADYTPGRSETLLKMKPHLDAQAVVVGHRLGTGKYRRVVGALEVESAEGRRFFVGSGLSDASRREPPAIGATITYRYRELTSTGLPRFATYLRLHDAG